MAGLYSDPNNPFDAGAGPLAPEGLASVQGGAPEPMPAPAGPQGPGLAPPNLSAGLPPSAPAPSFVSPGVGPEPNVSTPAGPAYAPPPPDAAQALSAGPAGPPPMAPTPPRPMAPQGPSYGGQMAKLGKEVEAARGDQDKALAQKADAAMAYRTGLEDAQRDMGMQAQATIAATQAHAAQMQAAQVEHAKAVQKDLGDIEQASKAASAMKVDPQRFFKERGTGLQILGAIGAALGAAGAALGGGPNAFLAIVGPAIERDIDAQKTAIDQARQGVVDKRNMLAIRREQFGDMQKAEAATWDTYLSGVAQYMGSVKDRMASTKAKSEADEYIAAINGLRAQKREQYAGEKMAQLNAAAAAEAAARDPLRMLERAAKARELEDRAMGIDRKAMAEDAKDRGTRYVKPLGGYVADKSLVKDVTKVANSIDVSENAIARIRELAAKGSRLSPEDRGRLAQATRALVISEKDRNELGQLTGGDWGLMPTSPDTINDWIRSGQLGALDELGNFLKSQRQTLRENYVVEDESGKAVPRSASPGRIPSSLKRVE